MNSTAAESRWDDRQTRWALRISAAWLLTCALIPLEGLAAGAVWHLDYDAAHREAVNLRRPLLIHFYGQTCAPCLRMEQEVFSQRDVLDMLATEFVAVKVDAGIRGDVRAGNLVQRYGVRTMPTDVIIDPLSGRLLSHEAGFQDRQRYLAVARNSKAGFDRNHPIAQQTQPAQPQSPQTATPATPRDQVSLGNPQIIVGLDGFSPVALGTARKWVIGKPEFAFEYKELTYYLATEEELAVFRERPEDFAPRVLGCDPVVLYETDRQVPGKTDFGAYFDGDLYLFESDESRRRFKTNPLKYTRIQHVLNVDGLRRLAANPDAKTPQ